MTAQQITPHQADWDFYPKTIDGYPASIFLDLAFRFHAPRPTHATLGSVQIALQDARKDGQVTELESKALDVVEDAFRQALANEKTLYVGRITAAGQREFFFYLVSADDWSQRVRDVMARFPGYAFRSESFDDAAWSTYFDLLLPPALELQLMQNRRVVEQLTSLGDALTAKREIDHWAFFADGGARQQFLSALMREGFQVRGLMEPSATHPNFGVQFFRSDAPVLINMDRITTALMALCEESRGQYGGWETTTVAVKR
jgi:uncharacterized protein (TIGR01619 family)